MIHETDVAHLREFSEILQETFSQNLADGARLTTAEKNACPMEMIIDLDGAVTFDRVMLGEPIQKGQRISSFHVDAQLVHGDWKEVARGTTVGYKRLLKTERMTTSRLRVVVDSSYYPSSISAFGLYRSSPGESL